MRGVLPALLLLTASVSAQPIQGRASVIDGDTIEIGGKRKRLHGIDAPESRQLCQNAAGAKYRCGAVAAKSLSEWLSRSQPVRCEPKGADSYGRTTATCFRADGSEVQRWLVRNGHALDWPRYSGGVYAPDQRLAERNRAGVWQGRFDKPWEWRRSR